jgi:signal transduction histidine kinase
MFKSLRGRLLASYVAIISITLCVIGLALLVLLRDSALPARATYIRLEEVARANRVRLAEARNTDPVTIRRELSQIAAQHDVRVVVLGTDGVAFDSLGALPTGQPLDLRPARPEGRGYFRDPSGGTWLYVTGGERPTPDLGRYQVLVATPAPRLTALNFFGENLLGPLLQAGAIALIVSIVLAVLISDSVARPLGRMARAARDFAQGDYDTRAPVTGPDEVQTLGRAFNHMADQVQRAQQTERDFLANVSHELKTPLTSIQGFSQAILDGAAADPGHAAQVIHDEAARMRRMVEDLLDLARIESGQVKMQRQPVDLAAVLEAVVEKLSLRAQNGRIDLTTEVEPLPNLIADGDRLAQVFTNLVDNALAHTPRGGQVRVWAGRDPAGGGVRVDVSDTGQGIPPEHLSRIFERFYQVDESRARPDGRLGGAGLGLTITKEIVEAHGGRVAVASQEGQGTTFSVWLPLARPDDATAIRRRPRPPA